MFHPSGSAGEHEVTLAQAELPGDVGEEGGQGEDHVPEGREGGPSRKCLPYLVLPSCLSWPLTLHQRSRDWGEGTRDLARNPLTWVLRSSCSAQYSEMHCTLHCNSLQCSVV